MTWWAFYHGLMEYIKSNVIYIELMHSRRGSCVDHNVLLCIISISHTFLGRVAVLALIFYSIMLQRRIEKSACYIFCLGLFSRFSRGTPNVRQNTLCFPFPYLIIEIQNNFIPYSLKHWLIFAFN